MNQKNINKKVSLVSIADNLEKEELRRKIKRQNREFADKNKMLAEKIKELEQLNNKLTEINRIDELTGLYNRRFFYEKIKEEILKAGRIKYNIVLAYLDIDNFKHINDKYGHDRGDKVLIDFGIVCKKLLREDNDFVFRFGGDEFVILLTNCSKSDAGEIIRRINIEFKSIDSNPSISYGFVNLPLESDENILDNLDHYINSADNNLYAFKKRMLSVPQKSGGMEIQQLALSI